MTLPHRRRGPKRYLRVPQAGLVSWQSFHDVARSRRRTGWGIAALLCVAAVWLAAFAGDEPGDDTLAGVIILEIFTLTPLGFLVARYLRLDRLLDRMRAMGAEEQRESAQELAKVDESIWRLARLAADLPPGVVGDAATEAFKVAERASRSWRNLVLRRQQLRSLLALTRSQGSRAALSGQLEVCEDAIVSLQHQSEELYAALGELSAAAGRDAVERDLERVREASERAHALATALDELRLQ